MELALLLTKLFFISWFLTRFEPLHMVLELLPDKLIYNLIKLLFTCIKCVLFWITLSITFDPFIASGMAFIGFWYDKFIAPLENKVRL